MVCPYLILILVMLCLLLSGHTLLLCCVLVVPGLANNLLSITQLVIEHHIVVIFSHFGFSIQTHWTALPPHAWYSSSAIPTCCCFFCFPGYMVLSSRSFV
ncbi:hypothetical protein Hanom_Chr14g01315331 [Helianthus anomalus]